MAKIGAPLMSIDARGNIAKGMLQFRGGLQGVHAYRPTPIDHKKNPASPAQAQQRNLYRQALNQWRDLSEIEREEWGQVAAAHPEPMSGWNLYIRHFMEYQLYIPENAATWDGQPLTWGDKYLIWE